MGWHSCIITVRTATKDSPGAVTPPVLCDITGGTQNAEAACVTDCMLDANRCIRPSDDGIWQTPTTHGAEETLRYWKQRHAGVLMVFDLLEVDGEHYCALIMSTVGLLFEVVSEGEQIVCRRPLMARLQMRRQ